MNIIKKILRNILPFKIRYFIWGLIPQFPVLNTYLLKRNEPISPLSHIDKKFVIREVSWNDSEALKKAHEERGPKAFERKIPPRLNSNAWKGLAVFDSENGNLAYIAWVVIEDIEYINEFGIYLKPNQCLLKDGYCVERYRHQGLHTRMEQERINFCIRNGATEMFIQIHDSNEKGKKSVLDNRYELYQQNKLFVLPSFNIHREFHSVIKNPFKKVIK
jgi:hypothetical protein